MPGEFKGRLPQEMVFTDMTSARADDMEALDIAFISKFISKKEAPMVVESLCEVFNDAIIEDNVLKLDVKIILSGMILKHIKSEKKQNELMEMIRMREIKNELYELVYEEYGDKLDEKDREIENKNNEIKTKNKEIKSLNKSNLHYKKLIKKLNEFDDLNTPEAKKIINSLMLL